MPDTDPTNLHADPLSELSRKERRNLLLTSCLAIAVAYVGLVPTRIAFLGVEFSPITQRAFLVFIGAIVLYFLFAFVIYGLSDIFSWRGRWLEYDKANAREGFDYSENDQHYENEVYQGVSFAPWIYTYAKPLGFIRVLIFEFVVPIVVAIIALLFVFVRHGS